MTRVVREQAGGHFRVLERDSVFERTGHGMPLRYWVVEFDGHPVTINGPAVDSCELEPDPAPTAVVCGRHPDHSGLLLYAMPGGGAGIRELPEDSGHFGGWACQHHLLVSGWNVIDASKGTITPIPDPPAYEPGRALPQFLAVSPDATALLWMEDVGPTAPADARQLAVHVKRLGDGSDSQRLVIPWLAHSWITDWSHEEGHGPMAWVAGHFIWTKSDGGWSVAIRQGS